MRTLRPAISKDKPDGGGFKKFRQAKFTPIDKVPIASRDYGLMRSNNKSSTPFPRVDHGVDASLLKARLSMRRHMESKRFKNYDKIDSPELLSAQGSGHDRPEDESRKSKTVSLTRGAGRLLQEELSLGTPHPKKGVALNAAMLHKRLTILNKVISSTSVAPPQRVSGKKKSILILDTESVQPTQTRTPNSSCVNRTCLYGPRHLYPMEFSNSETALGSVESSSVLSFAEKRKRFNMGEYTIAKGRKMSEMMMAATSDVQDKSFIDKSLAFAHTAKLEIEKYIRLQGLIKTSHDQLTMTRVMDRLSRMSNADQISVRSSTPQGDSTEVHKHGPTKIS